MLAQFTSTPKKRQLSRYDTFETGQVLSVAYVGVVYYSETSVG